MNTPNPDETQLKLIAAALEAQKNEDAAEFAQRWDDEMRRAFKGILPSGERRRILIAAAEARNV